MARIKTAFTADPRFQLTDDDLGAGPSKSRPKAGTLQTHVGEDDQRSVRGGEDDRSAAGDEDDAEDEDVAPDGMDPDGFAGPEPIVKPLTQEALKAFQAAQDRAGVVYISRIPPGMRPTKVRHLMSMHGEVGRVFLQQEDAKRAYLRKKYTATKKAHFTEGWVEFKDKRVARAVAEMLNAQPIGGKKGTRWRDDVWTMKYLPKFKWHMLTEQIAHEAAIHQARLRVELAQSRAEQRDYLRNVETARVLEKRAGRKRAAGKVVQEEEGKVETKRGGEDEDGTRRKRKKVQDEINTQASEARLGSVLKSIF